MIVEAESIVQIKVQDFKYPSFSIVIEWGRFLQTDEAERARTTLKRLCEQILQISEKISNGEIMIIFEPTEIEVSKIKRFALEQLEPCIKLIDFKLISTDLHYYEMKNLGAEHSSNELVLLVDSDVIIDDGWLVGYLESFKNPEVKVVSGHTYLGLNTLLEKVLGLVLFQPLPDVDYIYENGHFYGNNMALRRKVFLKHPFPKIKTFHGQCTFLMVELLKNRIKIYRQPKCKAAHPMPTTFKQFLSWGFIQGLSSPAKRRASCNGKKLNLFKENENHDTFSQIISRTKKRIRYVGLTPSLIICALGILPTYFLLMLIGATVATIWPNYFDHMVKTGWARKLWL